jgi:hypothetical protein
MGQPRQRARGLAATFQSAADAVFTEIHPQAEPQSKPLLDC